MSGMRSSEARSKALDARSGEAAIGPLFVSGRQHSGNTVTVCIFEMVPNCYAANVEGQFFEQREHVDRIKDPTGKVDAVAKLLRIEDDGLAGRTRDALRLWHAEHAGASAVEMYREGMRLVTAAQGKDFWVRRATSYIFYAEDILRLMPEARVLYLIRNPFDVCASKKRRNPKRDRFWGWVVSWNRGLRIAMRLRDQYPDRFLIVRYEDMVTRPEDTFRSIFDFAGVPFDDAYLEVPHVNRSEAHQTRTSATRGLNASRVHYYREILSPAEITAVDMLVWKEKLVELFPDLPHLKERPSAAARLKALWLVGVSPLSYLAQQAARVFRKDSGAQLRRILKRARIVTR